MTAESIVFYYLVFCLSGAILCLIKIFLPAVALIENVLEDNIPILTKTIMGTVFFLLGVFIGPAMIFMLSNEEDFIKSYASKFLEK